MFMKRCAQCGKRKFFLYQGTDICYSCYTANEEAKQAAEEAARLAAEEAERLAKEEAAARAIAEAKALHIRMRELYEQADVQLASCTTEDLEAAIAAADKFIAITEQASKNPRLVERILAAGCYHLWDNQWNHHLYGRLEIDAETNQISFDNVIEKLRQIGEKALQMIAHSKSYAAMIANLPEAGFPILDASEAVAKTYDIHPLKASNITARTPLSRLSSFIVIDLETTGLSPTTAEIIQIAAVQFINFSPAKCFSTFVKPRKGLSPSAQRVNGIAEEDVENAPYIEQVIPAFDELIGGDAPIIGHNLSFDTNFLMANGSKVLWEIAMGVRKTKCYDTLELARKTYDCAAYKLDFLCRDILHIIREDSHRASSDALATGWLFQDICRRRIGSEVPELEL